MMTLLTVDFETYYDREYSLSKITTEEYIRNPKFEVIGVSVQVDDAAPVWFSGSHDDTARFLKQYDWKNSFVLAHNTSFDGAILSWVFGLDAKVWLDTQSMARALHGLNVSASLASLAKQYDIGEKGTEVVNALNMRREDFGPAQLHDYGVYCCNDVALTYKLFHAMMESFPKKELKVIDCTLRMFTNPILVLDTPMLEAHLQATVKKKADLLAATHAAKDALMSNDKFAALLASLGVSPPIKVSAKTGRQAWAFAKTDEAFVDLLNHRSPAVQALVAARLGSKSTLEETRTERLIDISRRGPLPAPIKYYAAHTGRWGGDDKINLQNLPARGTNGGRLKRAFKAPDGYVLIDCDSSQIEARILAWLAGQQDLVNLFSANNAEIAAGVPKKDFKHDPYKIMAANIYHKDVQTITDAERFVGKSTILGAGYSMGPARFQAQLKEKGVSLPLEECERIITAYRAMYPYIVALWKKAHDCLDCIITGHTNELGVPPVLKFDPRQEGFLLPNGLWLRYPGLAKQLDDKGRMQYSYPTRKGPVKLYGGKVIENVCQALAKCVIADQMAIIAKRFPVVLTVHDAILVAAREEEAVEAQQFVETAMRWQPAWASGLPLNCESGVGKTYGDC